MSLAPSKNTGDQGEHGAPTEPPQSARNELLNGVGLGCPVRLSKERALNEVEVIKQSDPDHAEEKVKPAQDHKKAVVLNSAIAIVSPYRIVRYKALPSNTYNCKLSVRYIMAMGRIVSKNMRTPGFIALLWLVTGGMCDALAGAPTSDFVSSSTLLGPPIFLESVLAQKHFSKFETDSESFFARKHMDEDTPSVEEHSGLFWRLGYGFNHSFGDNSLDINDFLAGLGWDITPAFTFGLDIGLDLISVNDYRRGQFDFRFEYRPPQLSQLRVLFNLEFDTHRQTLASGDVTLAQFGGAAKAHWQANEQLEWRGGVTYYGYSQSVEEFLGGPGSG